MKHLYSVIYVLNEWEVVYNKEGIRGALSVDGQYRENEQVMRNG